MPDPITRRSLLTSVAGLHATMMGAAPALRPDTLDLRVPLREAVACLIHRIDPSQGYRPWFAVAVEHGKPVRLRHDIWDFGDTSGRFLEALILARQMIAASSEREVAEERIRRFLFSLLQNGVIGNPDQRAPDNMFSQGSALYALVTDYEVRPTLSGRARIEHFIASLSRLAVHTGDYLWFPQVATKIAPCSHMAAYQVLPVVRYYELTAHPEALAYAERLSRWVLYHDPTINEDGVISKTGWEGHLHAWMDTFSGIIRCSRAGHALDHGYVATRCRKLYEWVRATQTSPFGWVADSVGAKTCETDTITSAIRLALELVKEGHPEYWNDIERFVRNQLVENQFHTVSGLGIRERQTEEGLRGCFESWAHPNDLVGVDDGDIEGCCINGGIRGLFLAYQNAIVRERDLIRVNLLLSAGTPDLEVSSYLPFEGRLDLSPRSPLPLLIRIPDWLSAGSIRVAGGRDLRPAEEEGGHYLRLDGISAGSKIVLRFEQPERHRTHTVAGEEYRCLWRGDTVLEMLPEGKRYPTYRRQAMLASRCPMKPGDLSYQVPHVHW